MRGGREKVADVVVFNVAMSRMPSESEREEREESRDSDEVLRAQPYAVPSSIVTSSVSPIQRADTLWGGDASRV